MTARRPTVSIVLCAYNPVDRWLREAVGSALCQKECDIEVVVVDDGSAKPVADLLSDQADPRLRLLRVEHGGLANARNAGVQASSGRFLRFADADDVLEPFSTARLLRLAADGYIAYGATLVCDEDLKPLLVRRSRLHGWIAKECLLYRFDAKHMSMLFPRAVVEAVGDWDVGLEQCQDWDFVLRALEHAPVRGEQEIATYYRRHKRSASANVAGAIHYESRVVGRYFERHPERRGTSLEREARAKLWMVRAKSFRALGEGRREQLSAIRRALLLHPRRAVEELGREAVTVLTDRRRARPESDRRRDGCSR